MSICTCYLSLWINWGRAEEPSGWGSIRPADDTIEEITGYNDACARLKPQPIIDRMTYLRVAKSGIVHLRSEYNYKQILEG